MTDVLILTFKDLSNVAKRTAECLRLLGLDVKVFKGKKHMAYVEESNVVRMDFVSKYPFVFECSSLKDIAEEAKVLHFSSGTFVDTGVDVQQKTIVFQYGGRPFVGKPRHREVCTEFVNTFVDYVVVHHPFLLNTGVNNAVFIKPPIDTNILKPKEFPERGIKYKRVIGHFPSNQHIKGTKSITRVLSNLLDRDPNRFRFIIDTTRVPWKKHLERLNKCDIIIECLSPIVHKDIFGEWSTATLESAALAKITVTNSFNEDIYEDYYGKSSLVVANDEEELEDRLIELIDMPIDELQEKQKQTREWVVKNHSMESTAYWYWQYVYRHIFPDL